MARLLSITTVAALILFCAGARADIVSTNPIADTDLLEILPNNNLGSSPSSPVGTTSRTVGNARMLVRFDIGSLVPAGSTINAVTLRLTDGSGSGGFTASNFELHRMMVDWIEGNKGDGVIPNGATASVGEPTWNFRQHNTTPWGTAGGATGVDFDASISGSTLVNQAGVAYTWNSSPGMVADVQAWLDTPGTNFGWLLRSDAEGTAGSARRLYTREASEPVRPQLTIDFSPVPEPATVALAMCGVAVLLMRRRAG